MDWFLYDNGFRHERVNILFLYKEIILYKFLNFENFVTEKEEHYAEVLQYVNANNL